MKYFTISPLTVWYLPRCFNPPLCTLAIIEPWLFENIAMLGHLSLRRSRFFLWGGLHSRYGIKPLKIQYRNKVSLANAREALENSVNENIFQKIQYQNGKFQYRIWYWDFPFYYRNFKKNMFNCAIFMQPIMHSVRKISDLLSIFWWFMVLYSVPSLKSRFSTLWYQLFRTNV